MKKEIKTITIDGTNKSAEELFKLILDNKASIIVVEGGEWDKVVIVQDVDAVIDNGKEKNKDIFLDIETSFLDFPVSRDKRKMFIA